MRGRAFVGVSFAVALAGCGEPPPPAPEVSAGTLIERAISRHDPNGHFGVARIGLRIVESRPNGDPRTVRVSFGPGGAVEVSRETDSGTVSFRTLGEDIVRRSVDGREDPGEEELAAHGLDPERVMRLRNYYLFLWGLPMKLRDPGTIPDPEPTATTFDGRPALEVRVTYDPEVGGDTWYFYFDPDTARLIGYRFYHDEAANDGEYILLSGEIASGGLRLPATRRWFTHQDDAFLGEDEAVMLTVEPAP